jgi:predicted ATPase
MRLQSFEIHRYRNVLDSGVVEVEPDVTCLVGKNEAGKSAILSALRELNPSGSCAFNLAEDYPRWRLIADRRVGELRDVAPVKATFRLDAADREAVEELVGPDVLLGEEIVLERNYDGLRSLAQPDVDESTAVANLLEREQASLAARGIVGAQSFSELLAATRKALLAEGVGVELAVELRALEQAATGLLGGRDLARVVRDVLIDRVPVFFHFSEYSMLPGRIDLDRLSGEQEGAGNGAVDTTRALLALAGADPDLLGTDDYESRRAELEAVSNELTHQVFEFWTQNSDLAVSIDIDRSTVVHADGHTQSVRHLDIRINDVRRGYTANFAQRSAGFRWFFSFLAAFSELGAGERGVIVLLDEPGRALHARAQRDFVRFINERLAVGNQVLYTTHSPFMLDTAHLERVRIVEDQGSDGGSTVSELRAGAAPDSAVPVIAALGYEIAEQLIGGTANLLIEGGPMHAYVSVLSEHLHSLGYRGLDERWTIVPTGAAVAAASLAALRDERSEMLVLLDSSSSNDARARSLTDGALLEERQLIRIADVTGTTVADIEDLFTPSDYLLIYNAAFVEERTYAELPAGERIVERLERLRGAELDRMIPATLLRAQRRALLPRLSEATLRNFEQLFGRLNAELEPAPTPFFAEPPARLADERDGGADVMVKW